MYAYLVDNFYMHWLHQGRALTTPPVPCVCYTETNRKCAHSPLYRLLGFWYLGSKGQKGSRSYKFCIQLHTAWAGHGLTHSHWSFAPFRWHP